MKTVTVKDLNFRESIPASEIQEHVKAVAEQINKDYAGKKPLLVAILNGSFMFAADLVRELDMPHEITFIRLSSYEGTSTTGKVKQVLGLREELEGRDVIIVEDIIDSGTTMKELLETLSEKNPKSLSVCSLFVKPGNIQVPDLKIDYTCFEIPNDFIVGYGLDYDGYGRNLASIYTLNK